MRRKGFMFAFFMAAFLAGCAGQKGSNNTGVQNTALRDRDVVQQEYYSKPPLDDIVYDYKDIRYSEFKNRDFHFQYDEEKDASDVIPEALWFYPEDAGEGAICTKWERTKVKDLEPWPPKIDCWDPPEHFCQLIGLPGLDYYCSPDGKLCCNLSYDCHPCNWIHMHGPRKDNDPQDKDTDPQKCKELIHEMLANEWMVCKEWHY